MQNANQDRNRVEQPNVLPFLANRRCYPGILGSERVNLSGIERANINEFNVLAASNHRLRGKIHKLSGKRSVLSRAVVERNRPKIPVEGEGVMGIVKWQTSKKHARALSMRYVVPIIAAIMVTTPVWADGKDTARALGWAIGCGCLSADVDSVIKYLDDIFPNSSETKLKSLAGYVKYGKKDRLLYDNSDAICSTLCYKNKKVLNDIGEFIKFKEGTATPSSSTASRSNDSVCRLTLAIGDEGPRWDERSFLRVYVDEAEHRDLTPQKCAALLGRETTE